MDFTYSQVPAPSGRGGWTTCGNGAVLPGSAFTSRTRARDRWSGKPASYGSCPSENELPGDECWLIVARDVLSGEIKYFLSEAPKETPAEVLLHVAFSRWHIERVFED